MKIILAPDSFKESLTSEEACQAMQRGIRRVLPDAEFDAIPMADGGEGTVSALVSATGGRFMATRVSGPLGERIAARWGLLRDGGSAVIEMASASGLVLVPEPQRDPTRTTTFGTGELIRAALDHDVEEILVGLGGSATTDGGTGAAQAVGVRFLDERGEPLNEGLTGGDLRRIHRVDMSARDPRITTTRIRVACDVDNPLCGPRGAAAIYGPQKGATAEQVRQLDEGLAHLAEVIQRDLGHGVLEIAGAGAAGGFGAGLIAFFGATLEPGVRMVMDAVRFQKRIAGADLLITGEGRLDRQSMMGKVIDGVGHAGRDAGVPVVALAGAIGEGADDVLAVLEAYHCITPEGTKPYDAFARAAEHLERAAADLVRERS